LDWVGAFAGTIQNSLENRARMRDLGVAGMSKGRWLRTGILILGWLGCGGQSVSSPEPERVAQPTEVAAVSHGGTEAGVATEERGQPRVQPADFQYLGAFRLPGDGERPATFAYGANAATFNPDGDRNGRNDGFPGSLFIMGHDRMAYGELPNGNQIAEVDVPAPVVSKDPEALTQARFLQPFREAARGLFTEYDELPRVGMQYLNSSATGPKIHLAWGQHFHEDPADQGPTHAWIEPDLSHPNPRGAWHVGQESPYAVNGYLFEIPAEWADRHASGRCLATGRYRDGAWSGQGPALIAYRPWTNASGAPAAAEARLEATVLLKYANSRETEDVVTRSLRGYQHAVLW
jgi:hypothetical protein